MNAICHLLTASALVLTAGTSQADEDHANWVADFDVAVELAKQQNKDLLVDFTGSDWCGWCIKLHEEVFDHDAFLKPAMEKYILVALDFPHGDEAKARVPNPERNSELSEKYGVRGFPTILLMTPAGEVFGQTGYQPGGPASYIAHMQELALKGKPAIIEAKKLLAAVESATEENKAAAVAAVIAKVQELGEGSAPGAMLLPLVKKAFEMDVDNAKGLKLKALMALLKVGAAEEAHLAAAGKFDPLNEKGLLELAVIARFGMVSNNESALAAIAAVKGLTNYKNKAQIAGLFVQAARWCAGPLEDAQGAKELAQKAIDLGVNDEDTLIILNDILGDA